MPANGGPNLKQIAASSGVAVSTVSRILNGRSDFSVRDETRQRVLDAARQANYRPDPITRSLRAKRTNLIALVGLRDFGTSIKGSTEEAANALADRLFERGYELCTNIISPHEPPFAPPRWRVDGAVVIDCPSADRLDRLETSGTAYVTMNGPAGPSGSSVTLDDESGTLEIVRHLLTLGHKRIAYAVPHEQGKGRHESQMLRHAAYARELRRCGVEPINAEMPETRSPIDVIGRDVLERGATAVLAYHHMMAVKLVRAAVTHGLRVPHDLSIACFNDIFPCEELVPSLTAMSLPSRSMGRVTADTLVDRIADPALPVKHVTLSEKLIIRESTAPPPADRTARNGSTNGSSNGAGSA